MTNPVRDVTDDEFSAALDIAVPNRMQLDNTDEPEAVDEPAVEPEPVAPEVPELPEKYQGKSVAEIARMHSELEQRLGQQGTELGELRRISAEMEQLKSQLNQPEPEPAPWDAPSLGFDALDEQVLTNPKATLDYIVEHQPQLYERALTTLASIDPFAASRYDNEVKLAAVRSEYEQQLAAVRTPLVAQQNDAMLQTAYTNVANSNPLLATVAEHIPALLEENPEFKVLLGNGDVPTRERALNNLVAIAASRTGATSTPAESAAAKKIAATVASPGSSADRPGEKTTAETLADRLLAPEGTSVQDELARNRAAHAQKLAAR